MSELMENYEMKAALQDFFQVIGVQKPETLEDLKTALHEIARQAKEALEFREKAYSYSKNFQAAALNQLLREAERFIGGRNA